jgi:N-acetylmuramoyl-L-alanine amidase
MLLLTINIGYLRGYTAMIQKTFARTIVIDPGHGGKDGGASGTTGTVEKDINLAISQKLRGYIESSGDVCMMTRETDAGLYDGSGTRWVKSKDLKKRKEIINSSKGDIFISIHLNSFPQQQYYGAQVFYQTGNEQSKLLAECVQGQMVSVLDPDNKRVAKASDTYFILRNNPMPSIIVECGFLSNSKEEKLLKDEEYQNRVAYAIYTGILKYLEGGH